jgi:hypothetical protein
MPYSVASRPTLSIVASDGLEQAEPADLLTDDYTLDLGLSVWMRRNAIAADDCRSAMLVIRASLLAVAEMDAETEPIPLCGLSPEIDVANFVVYLADLFMRASTATQCEMSFVIERVSERLAS